MFFKGQKIVPEHERVLHYTTGESHKYMGRFYKLSVFRTDGEPSVTLQGENLIMKVKDPNSRFEKELALDQWYRAQAREIFVPILAEAMVKAAPYEQEMPQLRIYRLNNGCWGSCSPKSKILIMNLELIKVPKPCIEYIALHELLHFRYPSHDFGFTAALGNLMPDWKKREDILNTYYPM